MNKILLRTLLLLALLIAAPLAGAQDASPPGEAIVAVRPGSRVNMRSEPEVRPGNIVGKAESGARVEILGSRKRGRYVWYRVRDPDGGETGWIRGDLLKLLPPPSTREAEGESSSPPPAPPSRPPKKIRPALDWSKQLAVVLPAIRGCLEQSSAPPGVILSARPLPFDVVDVVLRDAAGRVWRCVGPRKGGLPIRYDPLGPTQADLLGTPNPEFYMESEPPPPDSCHELEEARDPATGTRLGMLRYDICQ